MKRKLKRLPKPDPVPFEALRWPEEERPVPMSRDVKWGELKVGWWVNVHQVLSTMGGHGYGRGCFDTVHHSTWHTNKTDSQGQGEFYATEKEALIELRYRLCEMAARRLNKIDLLLKTQPPDGRGREE